MVDVNRLSINFSKTNFMSTKSPKKKDDQVNIDIEIVYGTIYALQRKYLGVLLDETMFFKHHVSYMCRRITRNNGIKSKLRRYLSSIYSYIFCAILTWRSAYKAHNDKIQTK